MAVLFALSMIASIWQEIVFAVNFQELAVLGVVKAEIVLAFVRFGSRRRPETSRANGQLAIGPSTSPEDCLIGGPLKPSF